MSTISSGVGLVSGLPVNTLVDAMLATQKEPITLLQGRLSDLSDQRTAFLKISANLLAILNSASKFKTPSYFQSAQATSSNDKSVLATASAGASLGQFQITVRALAAANQVISTGFNTADSTPVGAGSFTIESSQAFVNRSTRLSELRGGGGIEHGKFRITDRAGGSATIDLAPAVTLNDVVSAINNQASADVKARVDGDHIVLSDETGLSSGTLNVVEVGAGHAAAQLGIATTSSTGTITGTDLVAISAATRLQTLNDGNGIRRLVGANDFNISLADGSSLGFSISDRVQNDTPLAQLNSGAGVPAGSIHVKNRAGAEADINLSSATTLGDVKTKLESAGLGLTVALGLSGLTIHDTTSPPGSTGTSAPPATSSFEISEVSGGGTAKALGILGAAAGDTITGNKIYFVETVQDLERLINSAPGNNGKLLAQISADGLGLTLTDNTSGSGTFQVTEANGSKAAEDLGLLSPANGNQIVSRRLVAGLNSVLLRTLRGGSGVHTGVIRVTNRAGAVATIDLSAANSLSDVVDGINAAGAGVRASISPNGLGISLSDTSGGSGSLSISDISGTLAADLGIQTTVTADSISSGNLQRQYVSTNTRLKDLRGGVPPGKFRITNSTGASAVVDLTQGNEERITDVLDEINSRGIGVTATINASGDGILLTDTAAGSGTLKVTEEGGVTAKALGILGQAAPGQTTLNGSFEYKVTLTAGDTLQDLVAKIKASGAPVTATILRDGSSDRPYRLSLTSSQSGLDGQLALDTGNTNLSFSSLVQAHDASVIFGPADADVPVVLNSTTNTLLDAVPNVRLDLLSASPDTSTISISQDSSSIVKDLNLFVSAVNTALSTIDDLTHFDDKTNARSVLTGDSTVRTLRDQITSLLNNAAPGLSPPFNRLSAIGITLSGGNSVTLDEDKFKAAFERDPDTVSALFSKSNAGFGFSIETVMKRYTDTGTGVLAVQDDSIQKSQDLLNARITQLQALLDSRRQRLVDQFNATEQVISQLQSQQSALTGIQSMSFLR